MKKIFYFSVTALLFIAVAFTGCKKDDDNDNTSGGDNPPATGNYRMTQAVDYENNVATYKEQYFYSDEQLDSIISYTPETKELEKSERILINYIDGNTFEKITLSRMDSAWMNEYKEVVKHQNGLWQEYKEYYSNGDEWNLMYKTEYSYNGNLISNEHKYNYYSGSETEDSKTEYHWSGTLPAYSEHYSYDNGEWVKDSKDTISISGNKITQIVSYSYDGGYSYKVVFNYSGEKLTSLDIYTGFNGTWTSIGSTEYTYDANGNIIKQQMTAMNLSYTSEYTYEAGKSNLLMINENTGWISLFDLGKKDSGIGFDDVNKIKDMIFKINR